MEADLSLLEVDLSLLEVDLWLLKVDLLLLEGRLLTAGGRPLTPGGRPLTPGGRPLTPGGRPLTAGGRPLTAGGRPLTTGGRLLTTEGRPLSSISRHLSILVRHPTVAFSFQYPPWLFPNVLFYSKWQWCGSGWIVSGFRIRIQVNKITGVYILHRSWFFFPYRDFFADFFPLFFSEGFTQFKRTFNTFPIQSGGKSFLNFFYREDGVCMTGSSIIKIILGILFEGFLTSFPSVSGLKSEGGCPFFMNEVYVF